MHIGTYDSALAAARGRRDYIAKQEGTQTAERPDVNQGESEEEEMAKALQPYPPATSTR